MMSYEEFTQKEAALESAPRAEREAFYAEILEKETAKTDVRMMAYFRAARLHYREGDFRAAREILEPFVRPADTMGTEPSGRCSSWYGRCGRDSSGHSTGTGPLQHGHRL